MLRSIRRWPRFRRARPGRRQHPARPTTRPTPRPGPVTLDLRALNYLSSAGVELLIQGAQHAATHHTLLQLQLTPHSLVARVLAITGLEHTLPLATPHSVQSISS